MNKCSHGDIPSDYRYYRSHSIAFISYVIKYAWKNAVLVDEWGDFGYIVHYLWWVFSIGFFEKSDIAITPELLKKYGMKRGLIFWSWWKNIAPIWRWWIRLGYFFSHLYHHSTRSAFSVIDDADYAKKWSPNARWHIRKIRKELDAGIIKIDTETSLESFTLAYRKTPVHHKWKRYNIWRQKYLSTHFGANIRIYSASIDGEILAGAVFLDDMPTSTYLIAFQHDSAKSHHLGLALIDRWYAESQKLGYRYLDLDHMQDTLDPSAYAWYTRFKSELADYELRFPYMWMRLFC